MPFLEADIGALARCLAQVSDDPAALVEGFFERTEQTALAPRGETAAHRVWREEGFSIRLASRDETWMVSRDGIDGTEFLEALRKTARRMAQGLRPPPRLRAAPAPELPTLDAARAFRAEVEGQLRRRHLAFPLRLEVRRHRRWIQIVGRELVAEPESEDFWSLRAALDGVSWGSLLPALDADAAAGVAASLAALFRSRDAPAPEARRGELLLGASAAAVLLHEAVAHALEVDTLALTGDPAAAVGHRVGSEALDLLDDPSGGPTGLRRADRRRRRAGASPLAPAPRHHRAAARRSALGAPVARAPPRRRPAPVAALAPGAALAPSRARCPAAMRSPIWRRRSTTASTPRRRRAGSSIRCRDCSSCAFPTAVDCAAASSTSASARSDCAARWAICWRASPAPGARSRSRAPAGAPREGSDCRCGARRRGCCCTGSRSPVDDRLGPRGARAAARTGILAGRGLRQARSLAPLRAPVRRRRWRPAPRGRDHRRRRGSRLVGARRRRRGLLLLCRGWQSQAARAVARGGRGRAARAARAGGDRGLERAAGGRRVAALRRRGLAPPPPSRRRPRAAVARRGAPRRARRRDQRGPHLESPRPRRGAPRPVRLAAARGAGAGGVPRFVGHARSGRAIGPAPSLLRARGSRGRSARGARAGIDRRRRSERRHGARARGGSAAAGADRGGVRRSTARVGGGAARLRVGGPGWLDRGDVGRRRPAFSAVRLRRRSTARAYLPARAF